MKKIRKFIKYPRYLFRKQITLELVNKYIKLGSFFLEVGCASGDLSFSLADRKLKGKLIDFSEDSKRVVTQELNRRSDGNLNFELADIEMFEADYQQFDLVLMFEVLEHIKDDQAVIKKINKLLKSNGYLLISVPSRQKFFNLHDQMAGHLRRYEKKGLIKLLNSGGFDIIEFYSYGFPFFIGLKIIRDIIARFKKGKFKNKTNKQKTEESGFNPVRVPLIQFIANQYTLYPFIQLSKLFNSLDWSDGYLCLVRKRHR